MDCGQGKEDYDVEFYGELSVCLYNVDDDHMRASDRVWLDYTRPVWCEGEVYLSPDRSGVKVRSTCHQTGLVRR